jgi:hypothetical protein
MKRSLIIVISLALLCGVVYSQVSTGNADLSAEGKMVISKALAVKSFLDTIVAKGVMTDNDVIELRSLTDAYDSVKKAYINNSFLSGNEAWNAAFSAERKLLLVIEKLHPALYDYYSCSILTNYDKDGAIKAAIAEYTGGEKEVQVEKTKKWGNRILAAISVFILYVFLFLAGLVDEISNETGGTLVIVGFFGVFALFLFIL